MPEETKEKSGLSLKLTYSYALGDFCFTFFIMFVGYYLMFFLTDVIGFDSLLAAAIYTLVQTFETAGVIVGGLVIDRARLKGGKYRPWLLIGGAVCAVFTFLFFCKFNLKLEVYKWVFPLLYLIAYWGYNFMWVAFRALPGKISQRQDEVIKLAVASQQGVVASSLIFSVIGVKLLYGFSSIATGYRVSNIVYGLIIIICMFVVYKVTEPYDNDAIEATIPKEKVTLKDTLKCITGPMVPYFVANVLRSCVSVAIPALMVYYFNYVLHAPEGMTLYLSIVSVLQVVGVILLTPLTKIMSKTTIFRLTCIIAAAALITAYFFGTNQYVFIICMAMNNFCLIISVGCTNAFITDIADYNEYVRGMKTRGFTVSVSGLANTVASLVGGAMASFGLAAIGYDSSLPVQPDSLVTGIRIVVTLGAAAVTLLSLLAFHFYKLDNKKMEEVYSLKREVIAKENEMIAEAEMEGTEE